MRQSVNNNNMSERMIKYKRDLQLLASSRPSRARLIIQRGDDEFVRAINDAVWTTLTGVVPISATERDRIRNVQRVLRRFVRPGLSLDQRRRVILTRQGVLALQTVFGILQSHF